MRGSTAPIAPVQRTVRRVKRQSTKSPPSIVPGSPVPAKLAACSGGTVHSNTSPSSEKFFTCPPFPPRIERSVPVRGATTSARVMSSPGLGQ